MSASNKEVVELFMQWVEDHPELDGIPMLFGCAAEENATATVQGGADIHSPEFDEMVMRTAYQIGKRREQQYEVKTVDIIVNREEDDGTVAH